MDEYIAHQETAGIFSSDAPAPENDPRVLREYHQLVRKHYPKDGEASVKLYLGRYGFYRDWIDDERAGLNWAASTPLVDMCIGVSTRQFLEDLTALQDAADETILSDTFSFTDGYGELDSRFVRLHSPVAAIAMSFEAYVESLTTERRKKYRRMIADFEKTQLRFELSDKPLSAAEIDFVQRNLEVKWGSEAGYAYRQTLWSLAVQKFRPQQSLVMRVYEGDAVVFIQTMVVKGKTVFCQSITKDEEKFFSGLAAFTDFECVKALCGKYKIFDPSCRTGLTDPESIGIAKRATVNKDCVKPILAIGNAFPPEETAMIASKNIQGKEA